MIPADYLHASQVNAVLDGHFERASQEGLVGRPTAGGLDRRVFGLVDPLAHHPLELFHIFRALRDGQRNLADRVDRPTSFLVAVNGIVSKFRPLRIVVGGREGEAVVRELNRAFPETATRVKHPAPERISDGVVANDLRTLNLCLVTLGDFE